MVAGHAGDRMFFFLFLLCRYTVTTNMDLIGQVPKGYSQGAQHGSFDSQALKLFGKVQLERPLNDDSEASDIVQRYAESILITFSQSSGVRYEARIIQAERSSLTLQNTIVVSLGPRCMKEQRLRAGAQVPVTVQLCINRQPFLNMHNAVDRLSCMDVVLPLPKQPER